MYKILLIEDNFELAEILFDYFEGKGLTLDHAENGELGLKLAYTTYFDAIIVDLMLPRIDGLTICKTLRKRGNNTPVLMLTALDSKEDTLKGFGCGADDYLTKPFDLDILFARINALILRFRGLTAPHELTFGPLKVNQKTRLAYRDGIVLNLSPTNYLILQMLCLKAPEIVTKQEIIDKVWEGKETSDEVLRSHIYRLRTQIDKPYEQSILKTISKTGFCLRL